MAFLRRVLLVVALAVGLTTGGLTAADGSAQQLVTFTAGDQSYSVVNGTAALAPVDVRTWQGNGDGDGNGDDDEDGNTGGPNEQPGGGQPGGGQPGTTQPGGGQPGGGQPAGDQPGGAQPKPGGTPAPKPGAAPAPKPGAAPAAQPSPAPKPAAAPAQAPRPAGAAPAQAPRALPRTGETENWLIGGLAVAGVVLLGAGLVTRRRGT